MKPGDGQVDFWQKNSFLYAGNAPFIEALYEDFLENPESVPVQWRKILRVGVLKVRRQNFYIGTSSRS